jgi:hypothetical protein
MPAQTNAWYSVSPPICSGVHPYRSDKFRKTVAQGTVLRDGNAAPPPPGVFSFPTPAFRPLCAGHESPL